MQPLPRRFSPRLIPISSQPRKRRFGSTFLVALSAATSVFPAFAAEPALNPLSSPAEPLSAEPLSASEHVQIRGFRFEGNTVFSQTELATVLKAYEGREVTSDDLEAARRLLTQFYIDKGYINSGATLRDQTVKDGIVVFSITEGRLSDLQISGNRHFRRGFLRRQIAPDAKAPLNVLTLRDRLQLLRQNPNLDHLTADVRPGARPGDATLLVDVAETRPYGASLDFDNTRPPSVGGERLSLSLFDRNLTGLDDSLSLRAGLTHDNLRFNSPFDAKDVSATYLSPEIRHGARLQFSASKSDTAIIEAPFQDLGISSRSENFAFGLEQSLRRTLNEDLGASLTLEHRKSESFLAGEPFSFSPGDVNGTSQTTALRLGANYLRRDANQVLATRLLTSYGGNFRGSTRNDDAPNGRFLTLLGQTQFVRALDDKGRRLILRLDGQWANRPLLLVEKFVIGGASSVRCYRENQLVRDRGFAASAEFRYPLSYDKKGRETFVLAPFFDVGGGKNLSSAQNGGKNTLSSLGLGFIYSGNDRLSAQIYYGHALTRVETGNHDLQDRGIHFALGLRL